MAHKRSISEPKALLIALLAAAIVCALAMFLSAVLLSDSESVAELSPLLLLYFMGGLLVAALIGLPAFAILHRRNLARLWIAAVMGAVLGIGFSSLLNQGFEHMMSMAAVGAASAFAFWSTWRMLTGKARAT